MRVIAQTEVPAYPSFMHIAYVAGVQPENQIIGSGVPVIVGLILLCLIQRKSWVWKLGVVIVVAAASVTLYSTIRPRYTDPEWMTMSWEGKIYDGIQVLQHRGNPIPSDVGDIQRRSGVSVGHTRDVWGHSFRVTSYREGGKFEYRVVSAGEDGKFGTGDDVLYPSRTNVEDARWGVEEIHGELKEAIKAGRPVPKGTETNPSQWGITYAYAEKDPWGNDYVIRRDKAGLRVISAGPDKRIDTEDDIMYPPHGRH